MKKFFDKNNFLPSTFDKKQKRQSLFVSLLLILFFIFTSLTFFNAIYCLSDALGSTVSGSPDVMIKDMIRTLPSYLSLFMCIWGVLLLHGTFRNVSDERRIKSNKKNAITLIAFGGFSILYTIIMRFTGVYYSLVEGSPSPFYPLDSMLFSLLFIAIGILVIIYLRKWQDKLPYQVPSRGPIVKKCRVLYCVGMSIWLLVALFGFSGFFIGLFVLDFVHGYVFYNIGLLLVYLIGFVFYGVWEFYFNELMEEKKKEFLLPLSIVGLCVSLVVTILYLVALNANLDGPSNNGFGILPIAFAASVNIATLVMVFTPIIVSIIALVKGILIKKQKAQ